MKGISLQRVLQNPYEGYILYGIGNEGSGYISSMEGTAIPHFLKLYGRSLKTKFHSIRFYEEIATLKIDRVFEEYDIYIDDISKEMKNFLQKDSENTLDVDWEDIRDNMPDKPIIWDSMEELESSIKNHHNKNKGINPYGVSMSVRDTMSKMDSFIKNERAVMIADSLKSLGSPIKKECDNRIPIDLREAKIYDIRDEVLSRLTINWEMISHPRSEIIVSRLLLKRLNEVFSDVDDYIITVTYDPSTSSQFDVNISYKS